MILFLTRKNIFSHHSFLKTNPFFIQSISDLKTRKRRHGSSEIENLEPNSALPNINFSTSSGNFFLMLLIENFNYLHSGASTGICSGGLNLFSFPLGHENPLETKNFTDLKPPPPLCTLYSSLLSLLLINRAKKIANNYKF